MEQEVIHSDLMKIIVYQCRKAILFTLRTEHPEKSEDELEEETDRILELFKLELENRLRSVSKYLT